MADSSKITVNYFCLGALLIFIGSVLLCALGFTVVLPFEATRAWPQVRCSVINSSYDPNVCSCDEQLSVFDTCVSKYPCLQIYVAYVRPATATSSRAATASSGGRTVPPATPADFPATDRRLGQAWKTGETAGYITRRRSTRTIEDAASNESNPLTESDVIDTQSSTETATYDDLVYHTLAMPRDHVTAATGNAYSIEHDDKDVNSDSATIKDVTRREDNISPSRITTSSASSSSSDYLDSEERNIIVNVGSTPQLDVADTDRSPAGASDESEDVLIQVLNGTNSFAKLYRSWDDSFHSECSLTECGDDVWNIKEARRFKTDWGQIGQTFACFYNPVRPETVIIERTSTVSAIHAVVWPCLFLMTGIALWIGLCLGCWNVSTDAVYKDEYSGVAIR